LSNILLVEPSYRSKFPPLGLMRLSAYHKKKGDCVSFVRGCDPRAQSLRWHRIYVSSLFTWTLNTTVKTIDYYSKAVSAPSDIFVGGVGATLYPEYIRERVSCSVIEGHLSKRGMLGPRTPALINLTPDYSLLAGASYDYQPKDTYFTRVSRGCIRACKFCAVPLLEKEFGYLRSLRQQVREVDRRYGTMQNLLILDNNILALENIEKVFSEIESVGFAANAKRNGRQRSVDFNQGIDARLIAARPSLADGLSRLCLHPVRLAFDFMRMRKPYIRAVEILAERGFFKFTNYMLFNFNDSPKDLFDRLMVNAALNQRLGIRITGFPMRFVPMKQVKRDHVSDKWHWRYLRGIQCVLLATRGLVGTDPDFVKAAFGATHEEFLEILAMPDRYIIFREQHRNKEAREWGRLYRRLSEASRHEFLELLADLRFPQKRKEKIAKNRRFRRLIDHYYPDGIAPRAERTQ